MGKFNKGACDLNISLLSILTIALTILFIPAKALANSYAEYGWHEWKFETCQDGSICCNKYIAKSGGECCTHVRTLVYDSDTCELSIIGETQYRGFQYGPNCPVFLPTDWTDYGLSYYPKDFNGNILPSIGGCNNTTVYYECSPKYQDTANFNNMFTDYSDWWYYTSSDSVGNEYKCMHSYKDSQGSMVYHRISDFHSIDPANSDECISQEAFDALINDGAACNQPPTAHNTGVYTTYNDSSSTDSCTDGNGDGIDDSSGKGCAIVAAKIPDGTLGDPNAFNNAADNNYSGTSSCGAPIWKINMVNMNLFVTDTPMWHNPPVGPSVNIQLSYNSQAQIAPNSLFGNKWVFNYSSYLNEDAVSGNVTIIMPDGRQDVYIPDGQGQGDYIKPYGVFNTLTKVAANDFELEFLDGIVYVYKIPTGTTLQDPYLTEIKDAYDQKLTIGYNASNQLETITDAVGNVITLFYNAGLVDYINDSFGRSVDFDYLNGDLIKITDMGGYWTDITYDSNSYIKTLKDAAGTWTFDIEPSDGTLNKTAPYPAPGSSLGENYRITITNPDGDKEEYYYHGPYSWYISPRDYVNYTDPDNNNFKSAPKTYYFLTESYQTQRISKILDPEGGYETYEYDLSSGKPKTISHNHDNNTTHSTYYTYNSNGLASSFTDAKGNITTYEYYPNDIDVQYIKLDLSGTPGNDDITLKTFTYNGTTHDISTITDRLGIVTEFTYYSDGRTNTITQAKGTPIESITELVYYPAAHQSEFEISEIKKNGNTIDSFTYDDVGRIDIHTDIRGIALDYDHNDLDKLTKITYPDTKYEEIVYSTCCPHLIDSRTYRSGLTTEFKYDNLKRLVRVQSPESIIRYEYDKNGNMIKLIDADKKETIFDYNLDNRLTKKTYADATFIKYYYDSAGLLTKNTNARNIEKDYTYDANHNLENINYSDTTPDITYTYDNYDRLDTMTITGLGTYDYGYDDINRLKSVDGPWADDDIDYDYNELGQLTKLTAKTDNIQANDQVIDYFYDYDSGYAEPDTGRLKEIKIRAIDTFTYDYTGVNPLIDKLSRPNGSFTEYTYNDPLKKLTEIGNKNSSQSVINKHTFTYNNPNLPDLIDTETITTGTFLDAFTAGLTIYSYNNDVNQLDSSTNPNQTFLYDNDGNMTRGYTPDGYQFTATYDAENRLISLSYNDGSIDHETKYYYSGDNILAKTEKYENSALINETRFVRSGFLATQERDGSNSVTREYTWGVDKGGGIGGLLNLKEGTNNYSYLYDGKGNVSSLIDSTQNIVASYRYDAFGKLIKETGTFDQAFRFSTKRYDEQTGLSYYGYRFYNPAIGRWMTRDPLGEVGGINLYGFVQNNPVNLIDPYGEYWMSIYRFIKIATASYGAYKAYKTVNKASDSIEKYREKQDELDEELLKSYIDTKRAEQLDIETDNLKREALRDLNEVVIESIRIEGTSCRVPSIY